MIILLCSWYKHNPEFPWPDQLEIISCSSSHWPSQAAAVAPWGVCVPDAIHPGPMPSLPPALLAHLSWELDVIWAALSQFPHPISPRCPPKPLQEPPAAQDCITCHPHFSLFPIRPSSTGWLEDSDLSQVADTSARQKPHSGLVGHCISPARPTLICGPQPSSYSPPSLQM